MTKIKVAIVATGLCLSAAAYAIGFVYCQFDNSGMYPTGNQEVVSGKMMTEYACPQGHKAWVQN